MLSPLRQALKYLTVRYRVVGDDLEHRAGVLVRTNNRVPLHRIRTVDITAPLANRLFGRQPSSAMSATTCMHSAAAPSTAPRSACHVPDTSPRSARLRPT